jgi:hypothetical protein
MEKFIKWNTGNIDFDINISYILISNLPGDIKMWSEELQELSEEYFEYNGVNVKTQKGDFGILNIDYQNKIYTISLLTENIRNLNLTFNSVEELLQSGWAVD